MTTLLTTESAPPALDAEDLERVTPELVLVSPELARFVRPGVWEAISATGLEAGRSTSPRRGPVDETATEADEAGGGLMLPTRPRLGGRLGIPERLRSRSVLAVTALALAASVALPVAAVATSGEARPRPEPAAQAAAPVEAPAELVVPDVRLYPFVFAKDMLDDAGFAWRVEGSVLGYAGNVVATQDPAPGTRVLEGEAPTVSLRLQRNPDYVERGEPQNASTE